MLSELQSAAAELRDTVSGFVTHLMNHPTPTGALAVEAVEDVKNTVASASGHIKELHTALVSAANAPSPAPEPPADNEPDRQSEADKLNQQELDSLTSGQQGV